MIGIYEIYSNQSGKCYIGSSINISQRWTKHKSEFRLGRHHCHELQKEYEDGAEFQYRMIEVCAAEELEAKEAYYIAESGDECFNTSLKTGTAMRDPRVSAKAVASRLDQSGVNANGAKDKEVYLEVFKHLINGESCYEVASIVKGISETSIRRIQRGQTHEWLRDEDPDGYELMLRCGVKEKAKISTLKQYRLRHKNGGDFSGNVHEISEKLGISPKLVDKLLKKRLIFAKGWKVVS